jgi:RecB family exonuclease
VPQVFIQLEPALEQACRESIVLTSTERLRRELIRAFDQRQVEQGLAAWPTPRVLTLEAHLRADYLHRRGDDPSLPELLGPEAEFQLFHATAPGGATRLVPLAREAWRACHDGQVPLDDPGFAATDNGRLFRDWMSRIRRRLEALGAITQPELPNLALPVVTGERLTCFAFEHPPRSHEQWLARQQSAGTPVARLNAAPVDACVVRRTAFQTAAEEQAAVAQWARDLLLGGVDDLRIGVVVPDLNRRYASVLRQFLAMLDPLLEDQAYGLVDIGGGQPLGAQPAWHSALRWLRLCYQGLPVAQAQACFEDGYLDLPELGSLPATAPDLPDLASLTALLPVPLQRLQASLPAPARCSAGEWLQRFLEILARAGWNGHGMGSNQFQAYAACRRRLDALAHAGDDRQMGPVEALQLADQFLVGVTHAPERPAAPIQIMGYLETTGLRFSHLWVTGLDSESWPQPSRRNPFLPGSVRDRYDLPRSTPEQELSFATERLAHWQAASNRLFLSHASQAGESQLRPSPLIRQFAERPAAHATAPVHPFFIHRPNQTERLADRHGPPLAGTASSASAHPWTQVEEASPAHDHGGGTELAGGITRIRDQAQCPFRGFAVHRLRLGELRLPHGLPDALDRGVLIHDALHRLYDTANRGSRTPADLSREDFEEAAAAALAEHYERFPPAFREQEQRRLSSLLEAWNQLESTRSGFSIEALEQEVQGRFDDLGLRLRVDRLDRIGDALIVIDYKSGRIGRLTDRGRLTEPQLPVYALCDERIQGVLYAEVNETRPRLKGISDLPIAEAQLQPCPEGWAQQVEVWRTQLQTLTEEIRTGYAAVAPHHQQACQNCHLAKFCRIRLAGPPTPAPAP